MQPSDLGMTGATCSGSDRVGYVTYYIRRAYHSIAAFAEYSSPTFTAYPGPELRSGRENRIIIYPGSFNPPHTSHAALLWHTYLNTDAKTVAVMIYPLSNESLDDKAHVSGNNGRKFLLPHHQRRQLWKDDVLGRFAWVLPVDDPEDLQVFISKVMQLADIDGFQISFPTLYGGDYINKDRMTEGLCGWANWTCIGSDVTRPMDFVPADDGELLQLPGCGKWKIMKNTGPKWLGKEGEQPDCWPCWPCDKMRKICPEIFENDAKSELGNIYHLLTTILARCHFPNNTPQWTRRTERTGYIIYIPSNRNTDPQSASACPTVSATMIREAFLKRQAATQLFRNDIKYAVLNVDLLCIYLRLDDVWRRHDTWAQRVRVEDSEDDLWLPRMRKKQWEKEMGIDRPRRASV